MKTSTTPGSRERSGRVGVTVGAVIALLLGCAPSIDDNQFREDVFLCEEAVARLSKCCPGFNADAVACVYYDYVSHDACGSHRQHSDPALTIAESLCIHDVSCEAIVDRDICSRVMPATGPRSGPRNDKLCASLLLRCSV